MKDLILITAHTPIPEKRKILHDLVLGLQPIKKDFDLMVVSHTPISSDVQEHVNWAIYDEDNELLTGWEYQNQPWFHPENKLIQSIFFGKGNTYLPVHKQLITGYSLAKTFGYEKIQCIEYDAYYKDFTEFLKRINNDLKSREIRKEWYDEIIDKSPYLGKEFKIHHADNVTNAQNQNLHFLFYQQECGNLDWVP